MLQRELQEQTMARASHDLRSPVTVIHQFTTILLDGLAGPLVPQQEEYLGIVLRNTKQLDHRISDLLEVSRARAGERGAALRGSSLDPQVIEYDHMLPRIVENAESARPI